MAEQDDADMTFEQIYAETAPMVLNLAWRMTGREEVARDLTQDVFLKIYQKRDGFRHEARLSTWVYRIALNHIINYVQREKRLLLAGWLDQQTGESQGDRQPQSYWQQHNPAPDEALEQQQKELIVRRAIDTLPAKYKIPLLLYRYEEMSYQQIAGHLQLSLSAVETRLHRAKQKLAKRLKPWLHLL